MSNSTKRALHPPGVIKLVKFVQVEEWIFLFFCIFRWFWSFFVFFYFIMKRLTISEKKVGKNFYFNLTLGVLWLEVLTGNFNSRFGIFATWILHKKNFLTRKKNTVVVEKGKIGGSIQKPLSLDLEKLFIGSEKASYIFEFLSWNEISIDSFFAQKLTLFLRRNVYPTKWHLCVILTFNIRLKIFTCGLVNLNASSRKISG